MTTSSAQSASFGRKELTRREFSLLEVLLELKDLATAKISALYDAPWLRYDHFEYPECNF